jgi:hypothetical protein
MKNVAFFLYSLHFSFFILDSAFLKLRFAFIFCWSHPSNRHSSKIRKDWLVPLVWERGSVIFLGGMLEGFS